METFEIPSAAEDAALRFTPVGGKLLMSVLRGTAREHRSVVLEPAWLRPLAAWLAGEAAPGIVGHDEYGTPYGRWLAIGGDETVVVHATHARAELRCSAPFGAARVSIGHRRHSGGLAVTLTPVDRARAATFLRRVDAEHWAKSTA